MSSRSIDSRFRPIFLVRFGMPAGLAEGNVFCKPVRVVGEGFEPVFREMPSSWRGWGTLEMEMERSRWSAARIAGLDEAAVKEVLRIRAADTEAALDWKAGAEEP